ncbi:MAG: ATPase [Bacteroidales bacterium]|nr:ATPase [Bacteroidales bacterium]
MKLIIDSGATKTQWTLLTTLKDVQHFFTSGLNPYYMTPESMQQLIESELPDKLLRQPVKEIFYYGTGCSTEANCTVMQTVLQHFFVQADITVHHDLYGAAVALYHDQPGIACILGTGSNSCLWNGTEIVENVPSLGYMLGDEGSGTYLGKLLLKLILSGETDAALSDAFYAYTNMDFSAILHKIYKEDRPNRWIAGLAPFAAQHREHPEIKKVIQRNFKDFIREQVSEYSGYKEHDISCTGSIAWFFQEELKQVLKEEGLKPGIILKEPMEGLVRWHAED